MSSQGQIDTRALDGLRGLAAIHVVVGHFLSSGFPGMEMSLFYLLSGFTLALGYGRRKSEDSGSWTNTLKFYQNRFARTAPSFYLSNAVAFCLFYEYKELLSNIFYQTRIAVTLTMSNSWFTFFGSYFEAFNGPPYTFNGPSWTVSTLTFMYLVFPWILPYLQKLSDGKLANTIVILYYIQMIPLFIILHTSYT